MSALYKPLCEVLRVIPTNCKNKGKIACEFHDILELAETENDKRMSNRMVDVSTILYKNIPEEHTRENVLNAWYRERDAILIGL